MAQQQRKQKKKQQAEDVGAWDRFSRWLGRNQKVVMVVLLVLIAPLFAFTGPVFDYFSPSAGTRVFGEVYGSAITEAQVERSRRMLGAARVLDPNAVFEMTRLLSGDSRAAASADFNPIDFFALRAKADRLGIAVSDVELIGRIQDAWRALDAEEFARREVPVPPGANNQQQAFQVFFQRQERARERTAELKKSGTFDGNDWLRRIRQMKMQPREVEETLREVYTIGKLQSYVLSDVQVSDRDVYDEFLVKHEKRQLSWIPVAPTEELIQKFAAKATEEELERYHTENPNKFQRDASLRASYVLVPLDHFKTSVEPSVTDEDLEETYQKNRNDYRRDVIRSDDAAFALRTPEETAARDAEIYQSLDEVRDDVRKAAIENKAKAELQTLVGTLRQRLSDDDNPAKPEDLAKEFPFLKVGKTDFASESEAEEKFGDVYLQSTMTGWFSKLRSSPRAKIDPPVFAQLLPDDRGRVFFTGVETRRASSPRFRSMIDEVRTSLGTERAVRAIGQALDKLVETQNAAGTVDLSSVSEVQVEAPGGEMVTLKPGDVQVASSHVKQTGPLQVWEKPESEDGEGQSDEEERETTVENGRSILTAGFSIDAPGKAAATTTIEASSPGRFSRPTKKDDVAYLIVLDSKREADAGEFDTVKSSVEQQLLRERQDEYVAKWRAELYQEAYGVAPVAAEDAEAAPAS